MLTRFPRRSLFFALALIIGVLSISVAAPAAVEMSSGIRYVIPSGSLAECSAKAKTALNAYLQNATESAQNSGEWLAQGPIGGGTITAAATVRCFPVDQGYVATFTCVVQKPGNPYDASALCLDVAHNFSGKPVTPLATPTPVPSGCSTTNLVGTWVSDDKPDLSFKMELNGDVTDSEGVSGNWALNGNSVSFAYYGVRTLTLSPDGKHLRGPGYSLTRKC